MIEIPGYRIVEPIGRGSTASVYRAVQLSLEREVAIKVLHPDLAADTRAAARFLDEARLLAGLGHPQIVQVWDVGVSPDRVHYFSMRFLPGGNLAGRIASGPMSPEAAARVLFGVAKALEHIHGRGLVHRGVSPGNILFDAADTPYLTDFGVARSLRGAQDAALADLAPAAVLYASPEQLSGARIDLRADLYALGVLAFECLTGQAPFVGEDPFEIAYAHVFAPAPQLPATLARWQPLVDQALAKAPDARMPGAAAFAAMVERAVPDHVSGLHQVVRAPHLEHIQTWRPRDEPSPAPVDERRFSDDLATQISARPGTATLAVAAPAPRSRPPMRRTWLAAGAGALVVFVAALAWMLWPGADAPVPDPAPVVAVGEPADAARAASGEGTGPSRIPGREIEMPEPADETVYETPSLDDLPTVVDPVEALTREGRRLLAARRLMLPPGDNAHERFRAALAIDPGAERAMEGLADVGRAYLELAAEADRIEERLDFWARGLEATAGVVSAWPVEQAIRNARDAERDSHLARARLALERWEGDAAREAVELALTIDPEVAGAQELLALAGRVGRPGFAFSDPIAGGQGPELVVIGDFALGRAPVTVGEFRRFWALRSTDLEAQRAACRDRESGWRSSRRRTWEDPGFAQSDAHPVVCVSPADAEAFAAWLSVETGHRYRLPSEAEWRSAYREPAACEAANRGDARFRASFGGRDGWDCDDGHATTSPVRSFAAVGLGLYDMDGNVREWSADCADGTRGGCRERKALGSAWLSLDESEPAVRALNGDVAWNSVGFRILREL